MSLTATEPCPTCGRASIEHIQDELTTAQRRVWRAIQELAKDRRPTYPALASRTNLTPPTLHEHVQALKKVGLVLQWDRYGFEIATDGR